MDRRLASIEALRIADGRHHLVPVPRVGSLAELNVLLEAADRSDAWSFYQLGGGYIRE